MAPPPPQTLFTLWVILQNPALPNKTLPWLQTRQSLPLHPAHRNPGQGSLPQTLPWSNLREPWGVKAIPLQRDLLVEGAKPDQATWGPAQGIMIKTPAMAHHSREPWQATIIPLQEHPPLERAKPKQALYQGVGKKALGPLDQRGQVPNTFLLCKIQRPD